MQAPNKKSTMAAPTKGSLGRAPGLVHLVGPDGQSAVYTGVSNRTRGWKSRTISGLMEGRIPPSANIKRWDGGAKACAAWDSLRRDPELWFDDGNCFVHLYGKGQSRRGPAFKIRLSALLAANCHPLLNRYLLRNVPESTSPAPPNGSWDGSDTAGRVDLYIPPPPMADKKQILDFSLAMRNLFAWICRRSMVGEHLGSALIALMDSMREFRSPDVDIVEDVLSYTAREGYLDMANQPIHALAMVHLAEYYQLKDLYINAFAHCAGMGDCLYGLPEYQAVSSITRKLLRRAQASVETKLSKAATSLRNFLEDDLSESNIGLTAGGRAHLERFRTFLLAFYTHRLGYYPPSPIHTRTAMWDPEMYRVMRADFEALYEFLVDRAFTTTDSASLLGHQGGICALQSVHSFDLRHKYSPLPHPLPRLPETTPAPTSKRMSWLVGKTESKLRPDRKLVAYAALVKATNMGTPRAITRNPLVAAYRAFEEDSVCSQLKFDRVEKLSQADARKIRWILIYGTYQTLRACTDTPPEVTNTRTVGYSLAIPTGDLPPWKEKTGRWPSLLVRTRSRMSGVMSPVPSVPSSRPSTPRGMLQGEIQPDVDYFALTHRSTDTGEGPPFQIPPRSGSLSKVLSRTGSLRKSLGSLRGETRTAPAIEPAGSRRNSNSAYHETVVHEYGNGTTEIQPETSTDSSALLLGPGQLANRSPSTSSNSSAGSSANASDASRPPRSEGSWDSGATSIPTTPSVEEAPPAADKGPSPQAGAGRRASVASSVYSTPDHDDVAPPPVIPRRNSKRKSLIILLDEHDEGRHTPAPLVIRKTTPLPAPVPSPAALDDDDEDEAEERWRAIRDEVDERCEAVPAGRLVWSEDCLVDDGDVIPEWDEFADVGGLTALS